MAVIALHPNIRPSASPGADAAPKRYAVMSPLLPALVPRAARGAGLEPYFVDIDPHHWGVSPRGAQKVMAALGRTAADATGDTVALVVPGGPLGCPFDLTPYASVHQRGAPVVMHNAPRNGVRQTRTHRAAILALFQRLLPAHWKRPVLPDGVVPSILPVLCPMNVDRNALVLRMAGEGVRLHLPALTPCHRLPEFRAAPRTALPLTETLIQRAFGLPVAFEMTEADVRRIVDSLIDQERTAPPRRPGRREGLQFLDSLTERFDRPLPVRGHPS